jgi:hypothetical protein
MGNFGRKIKTLFCQSFGKNLVMCLCQNFEVMGTNLGQILGIRKIKKFTLCHEIH